MLVRVSGKDQIAIAVCDLVCNEPCVCISQGEQGLPGSVGPQGSMGVQVCWL